MRLAESKDLRLLFFITVQKHPLACHSARIRGEPAFRNASLIKIAIQCEHLQQEPSGKTKLGHHPEGASMHFNKPCNHRIAQTAMKRAARLSQFGGSRVLACIAASAFLTCATLCGQQPSLPGSDKPEAIQQAKALDPRPLKQARDSTLSEQDKQIVEANAKLLKLATDLKNEVDKTTLDTLSIGIIRKAEEIEKLAHSLREKMKVTAEAAK